MSNYPLTVGIPMVYRDTRLGGRERVSLCEPKDAYMRVPDEIIDCVGFICYQGSDGFHLAGTGFFVNVEVITDRWVVYLVTAKHVIDSIRRFTVDQRVYIRLNKRRGGVDHIGSELEHWVFHPGDSFIDVAILRWQLTNDEDGYDYRPLPSSMFVTDEKITEEGIGIGDDIFLTGLFVNHVGENRNIPIVRVGSIAAMPHEPVETIFGNIRTSIEAYLVEVRSIGGLSGSPVFVNVSGVRDQAIIAGRRFFLLGLMHGHWRVGGSRADALIDDELGGDAVNMGIAIVVPASKIEEVLNVPQLKDFRDEAAKQLKDQGLPTLDSATPTEEDSVGITKAEFEDALRKVTRPIQPSPPDEASSET